MTARALRALLTVLLFGIQSRADHARRIEYRGVSYAAYAVRLDSSNLRFFWKRPDGSFFNSFRGLRDWLAGSGDSLVFATNAGIFTTEYVPLGLYIEDGKILRQLNQRDSGYGNFYMKPNGVFLVSRGGASIRETREYAKARPQAICGTQSGPLLVWRGAVIRAFKPQSINFKIRSGVGTVSAREAVFVISEQPTTFYDLARVFRDSLGCSSALYLDGGISQMYLPELGRYDLDGQFGPMIGVFVPRK